MWSHHLRLAFRSLRRDRGYALLNGVGLAVALACCLMVGMFVRAERQVDTFHPHEDRLRAVWQNSQWPADEPSLNTQQPLAAALEADAAVERAAFSSDVGVVQIRTAAGETARPTRAVAVSDGYLDLLGFRLDRGDRARVLAEPGVVLQERLARRLFGDADPMGQTVEVERYGDTLRVAVTGVLADSSGRSVLSSDVLLPLAALPGDERDGEWYRSSSSTFLRLAPGVSEARLAPVFERVTAEHSADRDTPPEFGVVPVSELHLSAVSPADGFRGDAGFLRLFAIIAAFVIALGVINYVNLATAQATRRAREVGVRKAVGAGRGSVAMQFLAEAVVLALVAGVGALALVAVLRPGFNALFGADLSASDIDTPFVLAALGVSLVVGAVAGIYPAFVLSGFRPVAALRGAAGRGRGAGRLRQTLVVVQLVVAVGLLSGTGVVLRQLAFAQTEDPGYDADGLVVVDVKTPSLAAQWRSVVDAVRAAPGVEAAVATNAYPSRSGGLYGGDVETSGPPVNITFQVVESEPDYLSVLGSRVLAGRLLDGRESDRTGAAVLNETSVRELGWGAPTEAVGRTFVFNGDTREVVGVVADQHVDSFRDPIQPMMAIVEWTWMEGAPAYGSFLIRMRPGQLATGVDGVREALLGLGADAALDVTFLDESVAGLYESERRLGGVLAAFAGVSILLACLGLFGLAAYTAERRTKEIGIRRVLGASVRQIVGLLTREYVVLVGLAAAIAIPAAAVVMGRWLDGFATHARLDPGLFVASVALALAFALLTVGGQALRAARQDPVRALRSE